MFDNKHYTQKIANGEGLNPEEARALLKQLQLVSNGLAYVASCQAATVEGLPKSTSKRERDRQLNICRTAAKVMQGDITAIARPETLERATARCLGAISAIEPLEEETSHARSIR